MPESGELRYLDAEAAAFTALDLERARETFATEIARSGLAPGAKLIEIGFGRGWFLDWARDNGFRVSGTEISPALHAEMQAAGHDVHLGRLEDIDLPADEPFDGAVAFDVFEHLTVPELVSVLSALRDILKDDGVVVARFPNGASPFGGVFQAGDITHRTALNQSSVEQLCHLTGFRVERCGNAARPYAGRRARVLKWITFRIADAIETVAAYLYFGGQRVPLDPNMVCVLRKGPPSSPAA